MPNPYRGCVYLATNTVNGAIYIGKSKMGMRTRMLTHFSGARQGYKQPFMYAIRKHGPDAFSWNELYCSDDLDALALAEIALIALYKQAGFRLYNATAGGEGASRKRSPEEIARMRGRKISAEGRARMSAAWTPERKAAHAEVMRARPVTEAQREASRKRMTGRSISPESIAKMAATKTGKKMAPWTPERRAKMEAAWARGCAKKTDEQKAKIGRTKKAAGMRMSDAARERHRETMKKWRAKRRAEKGATEAAP